MKSTEVTAVVLESPVQLTPVSWEATRPLAEKEWKQEIQRLGRAAAADIWRIGDCVVHALEWCAWSEHRDVLDLAAEETGLSVKRLQNLAWLASRFPRERRREELTPSHHEAVLPVRDEAEQDQLLQECVDVSGPVRFLEKKVAIESGGKSLSKARREARPMLSAHEERAAAREKPPSPPRKSQAAPDVPRYLFDLEVAVERNGKRRDEVMDSIAEALRAVGAEIIDHRCYGG